MTDKPFAARSTRTHAVFVPPPSTPRIRSEAAIVVYKTCSGGPHRRIPFWTNYSQSVGGYRPPLQDIPARDCESVARLGVPQRLSRKEDVPWGYSGTSTSLRGPEKLPFQLLSVHDAGSFASAPPRGPNRTDPLHTLGRHGSRPDFPKARDLLLMRCGLNSFACLTRQTSQVGVDRAESIKTEMLEVAPKTH
jgi:hypothetical protein